MNSSNSTRDGWILVRRGRILAIAGAVLVALTASMAAGARAETADTDAEAEAGAALAPLTVAESSDYTATSSHEQVLGFLDELVALGAPIRIETLGESTDGKPLVAAILADPPVDSPPDPDERDRLVVCIQGNIHAGEVEGKEAALMLLRDIGIGGKYPAILESCILVVIPNYNPDGNDAFDETAKNRPSQSTPHRVGRRHNSQGLDLNRDYMKARSTEFPLVARHVFNTWDPDIFMDLHTTNGSYHGYTLTYGPPLHPGGAKGPLVLTRDHLLPAVKKAMSDEHGYAIFDYGNFDDQSNPTKWATYDYRGRMGWLYAGLRGRIGILSEAYAYAHFRNRVDVTYWFVQEILEWAAAHRDEILTIHRAEDAAVMAWGKDPSKAPEIAIRAELVRRPTDEMMIVEETEPPAEGQRWPRKRTGLVYGKEVEVWDRFEPTLTVRFPAGYYLPPTMTEAREMLALHGIRTVKLTQPWKGEVETFTPTRVETANRRFSGGLQTSLDVTRETATVEVPAGWYWVPTAQRQGRLAVHLLEPDAADSFFVWHRAGVTPEVGKALPYYRSFTPRR